MMKRITLITGLLVIMLVLAACGGDESVATVAPTATEEPTAMPTETPVPPTDTLVPPTLTDEPPTETSAPLEPIAVDQPAPGPACALVPLEGSILSIYTEASSDSTLLGTVDLGHYILAAQQNADGWYQVTLENSQVDGGWIAPDDAFLVDCSCDESGCTPK